LFLFLQTVERVNDLLEPMVLEVKIDAGGLDARVT